MGGYRMMTGSWFRSVLSLSAAAAVAAGAVMVPAPALGWGVLAKESDLGKVHADADKDRHEWGEDRREANSPLTYRLELVSATRLRFTVTNCGKTLVPLVFHGPLYDVVIRDAKGQEVWRLSRVTAAITAIRMLQLKAGASLSYDVDLPELKPGRYTVEAYLLAINAGRTAGRATLTLEVPEKESAATQLATSVAVVAPEPGAASLVAVTVRNQGQKTVELKAEGGALGEVALSAAGRSRFWSAPFGQPNSGQDKVTWAPGETRTWFVALPELTRGTTYTAEVNLRDLGRQPVARTSFVAAAAPAGLRYTLTLSGKENRQVRLQVTNPTGKPVDLTFPSGQQFDLVLWQADGKAAWRWSADKAFTAAIQTRRLQPGATLTFDAEVPRDVDLARAGLTLAAYVTAQEVGRDPVAAVRLQPAATSLAFDFQAEAGADGGRLNLTVRNTGWEAVTLRFPSGAQYDFVLRDAEGKEVWRWSADRLFTQPVGELRLNAGATLRYSAELPRDLPPGTYTAEAWFLAEGYRSQPVARRPVTTTVPKAPLRFGLAVEGSPIPTRVRLTVTNPGREPLVVRFPSGRQYDFVLRDARGKEVWRWSAGRLFAERVVEQRLSAGASLTYDATLPQNLPAGTYTLEAWFLAEGYGQAPVARERVTVSARASLLDLRFQVDPVYERDRLVAFRVRVTNTAWAPLDLQFPTMQHLELRLRDDRGRVVWTWSDGEVVEVAPNGYRLEAGQIREYTLRAADAPRGRYTLELYFPAEAQKPVLTQSITIR